MDTNIKYSVGYGAAKAGRSAIALVLVLPAVSACTGATGEGLSGDESQYQAGPGAEKVGVVTQAQTICGFLYPDLENNSIPNLTATSHTVAIGASTSLSVSTSCDVGPTPYYIEIFDVTTGTLLTSCGAGSSCSVTVSQSTATTHAYRAYVGTFTTTAPAATGVPTLLATPGISVTNYVTWTNTGMFVKLTPTPFVGIAYPNTTTITASADIDVGPTPYYIEIYDNNNGQLLSVCGFGSSCTAAVHSESRVQPAWPVAFIAMYGTSLMPANVQASSNTVEVVGGP